MTLYCFYQTEEKGKWLPALASERDNIIRNKKPALVSVLDVDNSFVNDLTLDELNALRYNGPLYFDWDSADIDEAITHYKEFLINLQAKGVNLDMLRLYATGKKGFHLEIPMQVFMGKAPANGLPNLPDVYREMARALYVETLDLRVYSARRGRMWRCHNVLRDNGKYKVQITAEEALAMTPDLYAQVCSSPRNALPIEPPVLNPELGLLYAQARDKVDAAVTKKKSKKARSQNLLKFKGEWPETLRGILLGATVNPGVGWNQLSMQLAICAAELGKTEEQLLDDAENLINTHESDSSRYNSPRKRRLDLREQFRYMSGNPCYQYNVGAILSLVVPETRANADISLGDFVPDEPEETSPASAPAAGDEEGEVEVEVDLTVEEENAPIRVSKRGIFVRIEDGYRSVCDIGLIKPVAMHQLNGDAIGYELDAYLDNKSRGKKHLPMNALSSKAQFNAWALTMGASMKASDVQTSSLADIFRKRAVKTCYAVEREGIDIVTRPGAKDESEYDVIWAGPGGVHCLSSEVSYRYHGVYNPQGTYKSDLMLAPDLSADDEAFIRNLFRVNAPKNMSKMLGWFCAAFLTQLIRKKFKRFPSLQIYGQAGAGKSMTVILLNHMHYHMVEPRQFSISGQTIFPIIAAVATSASIPYVVEEVKARQLSKHLKDFLQNTLRSNYTADQTSRGSMGRDKAVRELTVTDFQNAAPIVFVGESIEDQSAILERCVVVAMSKGDRMGRGQAFEQCLAEAKTMGKIGKALALAAMSLDLNVLSDTVNRNFKRVSGSVPSAMADATTRPAFNLAVVLTGLEFLKSVLQLTFANKFDEEIDALSASILDNVMDSIPTNMGEASRVLDTMAQLTRNRDMNYHLVRGQDYTLSPDGKTMDLKLRTAYAKYVRWQRSLGMEVLFDTENAFISAMSNYSGTVKRACPENMELYDSARAVVYRLSLDYLDKEGVDAFEGA